MQHLEARCALLAIGRAAAVSISLFALASCVSAVADSEAGNSLKSQPAASSPAAASKADGEIHDAQVAAVSAGATGQQAASGPTQDGQDTATAQQGLTMQSTGLRAASSSIYGQASPAPTAPGIGQTRATTAGNGTQPALNATTNSLFSGGQPATETVIEPQEGASNETPAEGPTAASDAAASTTQSDLPSAVPLPLSAQAALAGKSAPALQAIEVASAAAVALPVSSTQPTDSGDTEEETKATKTWTFASLFAAKRKHKSRSAGAQAAEKKTITTSNASRPQVASLAYTSLPGVNMNPLFSMEHEDHVADEDEGPIEVANLSGLARLTPNGLILQTEKVETGCFKPELLHMLKTVERHYGRKVMVTSGLRAIKVNRKRQSLHTRCEAADIQVQGVNKWELADFLRSIPGRGGVGTYCHTESVHIDVGPQRDWNWRCRRRKG
ncbi:D-Ala-D-Ala carboxypeptidase family metallohydrolase [Sinorhizobium numidicum]|uniref:D-Ala-D-Ala carboxypeptidase family metallohydrolase n=1 Tax=Sinorhizobium numidicum TaxID=680248 RepID=A0ABY8CUP6_9HYPH|nr:D-Ala-D-Ala carboxypeptidase family metallohydrolase [Sinorhizobium numidicum]WEX78970.1 D-Ala-D-Ala carboxypeptidase family metallohydrolase [Sinorhizobium numidicum]WEX82366.1 D-Ala-D-Ala carboxypeptidase family metallohydrolase [Sinorhizobium numidicum]